MFVFGCVLFASFVSSFCLSSDGCGTALLKRMLVLGLCCVFVVFLFLFLFVCFVVSVVSFGAVLCFVFVLCLVLFACCLSVCFLVSWVSASFLYF